MIALCNSDLCTIGGDRDGDLKPFNSEKKNWCAAVVTRFMMCIATYRQCPLVAGRIHLSVPFVTEKRCIIGQLPLAQVAVQL